MALKDLNELEKAVIMECLKASVDGPFFPEWEFDTIFGLTREEVNEILEALPDVDDSMEDVQMAINNSLCNLLGYPHQQEQYWSDYISVPPEEVARILRKWRGRPTESYFDVIM
jgi:hypothetical protein